MTYTASSGTLNSTIPFIEAKDDGDGGDNWGFMKCRAPVKS